MARRIAVSSLPWVCLVSLLCACPGGSTPGQGAGEGAGPEPTPSEPTPSEPTPPEPTPPAVEPSNLADDETVSFLPTFAVQRDGAWQVPVDAWVYEPEDGALGRSALLEVVAEALELVPGSPESDAVAYALRPFVVDNERGKWVALWRGHHAARVGPTTANGRARGTLSIPAGDPSTEGEGTPPWVELRVVLRPDDARRFSAWSQLLPDEGISVISDIDDTIKITEVLDKKTMLLNTFARPYRAVPGMAEAYRRWADARVAFHYVSASPLPLLGALSRFASASGFPRGSLALRSFRWRDGTAFDLLEPSESYKREAIEAIVGSFERRAFVLVGDTGERDPEIYAAVARAHPGRIRSIVLRDPQVGGTPGLEARLEAVFEGLPPAQVIADGTQLPASP